MTTEDLADIYLEEPEDLRDNAARTAVRAWKVPVSIDPSWVYDVQRRLIYDALMVQADRYRPEKSDTPGDGGAKVDK